MYAAAALNRVDLVVYLSTHLNTGHAHGTGKETLILPVCARDEEDQVTTQESMFNYLRYSEGGPTRVAAARSEVAIVAELGQQLFQSAEAAKVGPVNWNDLRRHKNIRLLIARLVPDLKPLEQAELDHREFEIPGRVLHAPRFATPTGKARMMAHAIPANTIDRARHLRLMTIRSEGQFNTVVFEDEDIFRGIDRRDVILMSDADMQRLSLRPDDLVTVRSSTGVAPSMRVRAFAVRPGNVMMYCPEANVLLGRAVDPRSRTPAFKAELVTVEKQGLGGAASSGYDG